MKIQWKRRLAVLLVTCLIAAGISVILNRASFDPNFSVIDAVTGATSRSHRNSSDTDSAEAWEYSSGDLVLPDEDEYEEVTVITDSGVYAVLKKTNLTDETLFILSDKDNSAYSNAVRAVAEYYEEMGYTVDIREYSETMMLSVAHAGHFSLFLLREEAEP